MAESAPTREEMDEFCKANDVDENAAKALRDCPPDVQRRVLTRGELSTARNPSAALLTRIRDARASALVANGGGFRGPEDVEEFIKKNEVDESAATSLRSSSPGTQRVVLARGDLVGVRNPSSALLARIRDARSAPPGEKERLLAGGMMMACPYGAMPPPPQGMPPGYPGYPGYPMAPYGYPSPGGYPGYPGYPGGYPGYPSGYPGYPGQPAPPGGAAGAVGGTSGTTPGSGATPGSQPGGYPGAYGGYGGGYPYGGYPGYPGGYPGYPGAGGEAQTNGSSTLAIKDAESSKKKKSRSRSRSRKSSSSSSSRRRSSSSSESSRSRSRDRRRSKKKKSKKKGRKH